MQRVQISQMLEPSNDKNENLGGLIVGRYPKKSNMSRTNYKLREG